MSEIYEGCALRDHRGRGEPTLYGRVILINKKDDLAVVIRVPTKNKHGHQKHYITRPLHLHLSALQRQVANNELSAAAFETPQHWLLTPTQLRSNSTDGTIRKTRRNLAKWVRKMARAYGRIRPFVHGRTIEEILIDPDFTGWPAKRSRELGLKGSTQVQRDLNAYLLAMGLRNGLLPWYPNSGGPGRPKLSRKKTGRPREFSDGTTVALTGKNCPEEVRAAFRMGWKKFKKPGVSTEVALTRTLEEWFCKSIRWDGVTAKVTLKPGARDYTEAQFTYWGQKDVEALTATQIERGETAAKRTYLRRQNKLRDRHLSANGEAFLDSTSTDQTLVSGASRLKVLSAPWRTDVMGASIDYIFGHHVGFENPSATTALLAIQHASEDKVDYCARFGIEIKSRDWHPMTFRQIVTDNGEGKGALVLRTLEEMESGAEFGPAYDAINKSPVESGHRRTQRHVDHLMPGATMGRRPKRGEPDRTVLARLNFFEYMPRLIERVLFHNNVERIVLPSIEMRRDDVEPTRRGVLEWMLDKGYVSSVPTDLQALRIRCLPRLKACLQVDGLHLYDPTYNPKRIVPGLVYRSEWLLRSSLLARASATRWHLDAHMNPSDLSRVWVNLDGLRCLHLVSADPDMMHLTLLDWLIISRDDRLKGFLGRVNEAQLRLNNAAAVKRSTAKANQERRAEIEESGKSPAKSALKSNKRLNTAVEKAIHTGFPVPPKFKSPPQIDRDTSQAKSPLSISHTPIASDFAAVIAQLRDQ